MDDMQIFGDSISGNCLKVKWTADLVGLPYRWIETDILKGESRTPEFLAMNPAGQVPAIRLDDGRTLAQSNAIILFLAEGSTLFPTDAYQRARMMEWMFWEQYSHEPYVAVARFQARYQGKSFDQIEQRIMDRGNGALRRLEDATRESRFLIGDDLSLADIALVAYTRVAGEGGFDLAHYPGVRRWIADVEAAAGIRD
jgi:glutathione S-transferase